MQAFGRGYSPGVFGDIEAYVFEFVGLVDGFEGGVVGADLEQFGANAFVFVVDLLGLQVHEVLVEGLELLRFGPEFVLGVGGGLDDLHLVEQYFVLLVDFCEFV